MTVTRPIIRLVLLVIAIIITALAAVLILPDQPIPLNTPGDAAINSTPAIRISLAKEAEPSPTPHPEPKAAQPPSKPKPAPQVKPKPEPEPEPEPEIVAAPEPKPTAVATPEHQTPPAPEQPETAASATTDSPAADTATGEPEQSSSVELNAGTSQATDSYLGKLSRHLSRFYEYPRRARRLGQEGVPVIIFRFRRDGSLVKHYLQNSSGHELLDKAALDMLKQAEPLPPVPETMAGQTFSYALPIRFSLR